MSACCRRDLHRSRLPQRPGKRPTSRACELELWPYDTLVLLCDRGQTLVNELLDALAAIGLRGINVALRIGGNAVHGVKLAGLPAAVPKAGQNLECVTQHDVDLLVCAVRQKNVLLLRIFGESDVPNGSIAARIFGYEYFLHECPIRFENLDAVVRTIAYIQQTIVRKLGTVHGIPELLRGGIVGLVRPEVSVVGLVPVCAPMPLVLASLRVEYDHAVIAVTIGNV